MSLISQAERTRLRSLLVAVVVAGVLTVAGCATANMDAPSGFAVFSEHDDYVSTSPEGVVLRARLEENDPQQDLSFWAEALERNLIESGYLLVDQGAGTFEASIGAGRYFQWLAPVGQQDWFYLTAIAVDEKWIAVVEAAGPHEFYRKHQEALLDSLASLRIERSL
jgi:hypothetical protein